MLWWQMLPARPKGLILTIFFTVHTYTKICFYEIDTFTKSTYICAKYLSKNVPTYEIGIKDLFRT